MIARDPTTRTCRQLTRRLGGSFIAAGRASPIAFSFCPTFMAVPRVAPRPGVVATRLRPLARTVLRFMATQMTTALLRRQTTGLWVRVTEVRRGWKAELRL